MSVGERIRNKRIELGLTQEELALRMGYSGKSSVCKAETYGDSVTTAKIQKFADALGVSFSYLMGWDEEPIELKIEPEWEEQELLALWRNATDSAKESVLVLLKNSQKGK